VLSVCGAMHSSGLMVQPRPGTALFNASELLESLAAVSRGEPWVRAGQKLPQLSLPASCDNHLYLKPKPSYQYTFIPSVQFAVLYAAAGLIAGD
jgi:hypothetical protein